MNKKVCLVVHDFAQYGGVGAVCAAMANELCHTNQITVLSLIGEGRPNAYSLDKKVAYYSLMQKARSLREEFFSMRGPAYRYLRQQDFDTIILMGHYPGFLLGTLQVKLKANMIFVDHGALMSQWNEKEVRFMRLLSAKACRKTITITSRSRDDYIEKFHIKPTKLQCIYNWVDLDEPHSEQYDVRSKRIVSAGRIEKEKGFDQLIHAFAPVAEKHPDWQIDIFGDGEMMDEVKHLIAHYNLESSVNLMGMREDLSNRYKDYAMYVLPSYREGLPLVLLEAKANRLPIVSFDVLTGPREIIGDGIDGILVPPENTKALGEAMCRMIEDDNLRQRMSEHSWDNLNKFSKEKILDQWEELLDTI